MRSSTVKTECSAAPRRYMSRSMPFSPLEERFYIVSNGSWKDSPNTNFRVFC